MELDVSHSALLAAGEGEVVRSSPDGRLEILSDRDELSATWTRYGPRREGADLHVHRHHTDVFYVLGGELTVRLGIEDRAVVVRAGTLVRVPPLVVHGFRNGGDEELVYLNFHAPGHRFAGYLRALRDRRPFSFDQHEPPPDGGRSPADAAIGERVFVADRPALRVALLADVEEIGVSEAWGDPGGPSPPPHLHARHVESFYVLEGQLTFTVDGRELRATAGSWVQVPPGAVHTFAFTGDAPVRFLNLHTPGCGYGDFVRGLHEARTDEELAVVRAAFDQVAV